MDVLNKPLDKVEIKNVRQKQQETRHVLVNTIKPKRGHTLFKFDKKTKEITKAEFEEVDIDYSTAIKGDLSAKRKVVIEGNCLYISALNKTNVIKILERDYNIKL